MINKSHRTFQTIYLAIFAMAAAFVGVMPAKAAGTLCGVEFDAMKYGFETQAVHPDEQSGCGRFLVDTQAVEQEKAVVSIVVLSASAKVAMATNPSNFIIKKDGSLKFKLPKQVSDSRSFYFVRPLRVLSEKTLPMPDGVMYIAEYDRRVNRLKKISDQEEQEITEQQRCVDAVRATKGVTVIVSGCDLACRGPDLYARVSNLLKSARLPIAATGNEHVNK